MGWHRRLNHLNTTDIMRMANYELATGINVTDKTVVPCQVCLEAKQSRSNKAKNDSSTSAPTDEIGAVLCVDMKVNFKPRDWQGNQHVLNVVDHASSYGDVFMLKTKDTWFTPLTGFVARFERQHGLKVKVIRGDGEFGSGEFRKWAHELGIRLQLTERDESSSNGKVERRHRTVFNGMRSLMFDNLSLPRTLWSEAVKYTSWMMNLLTTRVNPGGKSPIEMPTGRAPDLAKAIRWGQVVSTHIKRDTMGTHPKG